MPFAAAQRYLASLQSITTLDDLRQALVETCERLDCRYYALTQHLDFSPAPGAALRLHNYPEPWQQWFDGHGLGVSDPIHRASHVTALGFRWDAVATLIALSPRDHQVLAAARAHGIGQGFTVPGNVPGETLGSCSFARAEGEVLDDACLPMAQLAGQLLFETGRRIMRKRPTTPTPPLTDRQIECIMWVGRGKTDWEIAHILGVSPATVIEHLRHARERYDTPSRATLTVRALYEGAVCFSDLIA